MGHGIEAAVMKRRISMILVIGWFASTIPVSVLANPGNPYWNQEHSSIPAPFSDKTARILGESPDERAAEPWPTDKPLGTGATPSDNVDVRTCREC